MIINDAELKGIKIDDTEHKCALFADDSTLFLRNFLSLPRLWDLLKIWEDATGMKVNRTKTEGLRLGRLVKSAVPDLQCTEGINWVKPNEWLTLLGVPFGEKWNSLDFYEAKYRKMKCLLANWHAVTGLTTFGRAMIANSLVYSRFRYWAYTIHLPKQIMTWLESDITALVWEKGVKFFAEDLGTDSTARRWMLKGAALLSKRELGLGMLHWPSHVKAIQSEIILRYLNGECTAWKLVLDQWFRRYHEERGAVFSTIPVVELTRSLTRRASALPAVFKHALRNFRELTFTKISGYFLTKEEALAEPLWTSRLITLNNTDFSETWRIELETNRVQDLINFATNDIYSEEYLRDYITKTLELTPAGLIKVRGGLRITVLKLIKQFRSFIKAIPHHIIESAKGLRTRLPGNYSEKSYRMMKTMGWLGGGLGKNGEGIVEPIEARKPRKTKKCTLKAVVPKGDITNERKTVYGFINSDPKELKLDAVYFTPRGRPVRTGESIPCDEEELREVITWGSVVVGIAEAFYPHPKGWCISSLDKIHNLETLNVNMLTAAFRRLHETAPTNTIQWPARLGVAHIPWREIGERFHSKLMTSRDYHSYYKCILHRAMRVRHFAPVEGSHHCRLCNLARERIEHFVTCHRLRPLWQGFVTLCRKATFTNDPNPGSRTGMEDWALTPELILLGCYKHPYDDTELKLIPRALYTLLVIIWKFTIVSLAAVDTEGAKFKVENVWKLTIRRFHTRVNAAVEKVRRVLLEAAGRAGNPPALGAINAELHPLAHLDARGHLHWGDPFRELSIEVIGDVEQFKVQELDSPARPISIGPRPIRFVTGSVTRVKVNAPLRVSVTGVKRFRVKLKLQLKPVISPPKPYRFKPY